MKVMISTLFAIAATAASAQQNPSNCPANQFRGTWMGTCTDSPMEKRFEIPPQGGCHQVNFDSQVWNIGQLESHTISGNVKKYSQPQMQGTIAAVYSEVDSKLTLFRHAYALPIDSSIAEPGNLVVVVTNLKLEGNDLMTFTELRLDSSSDNIAKTTCTLDRI